MSRIAACFERLAGEKRKAYVAYTMAGFPDEAQSLDLGRELLNAGADMLEIGVPFSDPIADGPVVSLAAEKALAQGGSLEMSLRLLKALRAESEAPLLLMSYLNPLLARGIERFAQEAKLQGADGIVVPDLTPEESAPWAKVFKAAGLDIIFLAAPTSTPARLKIISKAASGFIYVVSVAGVTGERSAFDARLDSTITELRKLSPLPLAVGFGVSSAESAKEAASKADGVVVASTVLKPLLEGQNVEAARYKASALILAAHGVS